MAEDATPKEPFYLHGYPDTYTGDQGDDDYWSWVRRAKPIAGLLRIEQRAKELGAEADSATPTSHRDLRSSGTEGQS